MRSSSAKVLARQPSGLKPVKEPTRRFDLPPAGPSASNTPRDRDASAGNVFAPSGDGVARPSLTRVFSDSSLVPEPQEPTAEERIRRVSQYGSLRSLSHTRLGLSIRTSAENNKVANDDQPGSSKSTDANTPKQASAMMWQPNGIRSTSFKKIYAPKPAGPTWTA